MADNLTFEQANERINEIVEIMEKGNLPLEESMAYYEEAFSLFEFCFKKLNDCKLKITDINNKIDSLMNSGEPIE